MRLFLKWLMLVASIIAAMAVGFGAYRLADKAWTGVVDYRSPYAGLEFPQSVAASAESSRVVVVIVDGLRLDASRDMSTLEALRGYGLDLTLTAPQPSLSYPNWTTILSGTTQDYHGVITNWHKGPAPVETLLDTAVQARVPFVVVGPSDIATLYPAAKRADASYFQDWSERYLSATYIDKTLQFVKQKNPRLVLLHLPDIDEAGHDFGGASPQYADMVGRVDFDLRRLVEKLQAQPTTFVIVSDHGHTDTGGHGGWEPDVIEVPCVISGEGVQPGTGSGRQEDVAPMVALLSGIGVPRHSTGTANATALLAAPPAVISAAREQRRRTVAAYAGLIRQPLPGRQRVVELPQGASDRRIDDQLRSARAQRLVFDRSQRRFGSALWLGLSALLLLVVIGVVSWRALLAALWGCLAYYVVYDGLFFVVHGYRWSLSAFNSEDLMAGWMNARLAEAAAAGLVAVLVASLVYPLLRREQRAPRRAHLPGWLGVGPATVLVIQMTLALQAAWFLWGWGLEPVWALPDLRLGFKFDLDLVQVTALAGAALVAPLVSYVVGRVHPWSRVRKSAMPTSGSAQDAGL